MFSQDLIPALIAAGCMSQSLSGQSVCPSPAAALGHLWRHAQHHICCSSELMVSGSAAPGSMTVAASEETSDARQRKGSQKQTTDLKQARSSV